MKLTSSSDIDMVALAEEITKEWPPERIAEWLLTRERSRYKFYKRRRVEIEIENKEARVKGVSYKDRQKFSKQLDALDRLMVESEANGKKISESIRTKQYMGHAVNYITTDYDAEFIHSRGFETHLRYATM